MAVPTGFCQAEITFICLSLDTTIQLFIGATPITNPFPVTQTDTQLTLQATITANTIGSGVTITIQDDSVFPLTCTFIGPTGTLHLLIEVPSAIQITDSLTATDSNEGFQFTSSTPFSCNLATSTPTPNRKKIGVPPELFRCPDEIIFRADAPHPQVKYCNTIYNFYSIGDNGCFHYISSRSNAYQRGSRYWRTIHLGN